MNVNSDLTVMDYWPDREISRNQGFWRTIRFRRDNNVLNPLRVSVRILISEW